MKIEVSAGECFDKISILEIKSEKLQEEKRQHAIKERDHLKESVGEHSHVFDRRFNLKNKINEMTNSEFKEQKSHDDCD